MVQIVLNKNNRKISTTDINYNDKITRNIRYKCIDSNCKSELVYVNKHIRNGVNISPFFKHLKNECHTSKFYEENRSFYENDFYEYWINLCKNCNIYQFNESSNYLVDIYDILGKSYVIRCGLLSNNQIKKITIAKIDNIILSGKERYGDILYIDYNYYLHFTNKNDISIFNNKKINVYIDFGYDKICLLKRDNKNGFIIDTIYGNQIDLIDINKYLYKQFKISCNEQKLCTPILTKNEYYSKYFNNKSTCTKNDYPDKTSISGKEIKSLFNIWNNSDYNNDIDMDQSYHIEQTETKCTKYCKGDYDYSDKNISNGMKQFFKYHSATNDDIKNMEKRIDFMKTMSDNDKTEYFIENNLKDLYNIKSILNKSKAKCILILNDEKSLESIHNCDDLLLCWYILNYLHNIVGDSLQSYIHKYPKLKSELKESNISDNFFVLCKMIPFDKIDNYYLNTLKGDIHNKYRLSVGIDYIVKKHNIYYESEYKLHNVIKHTLKVDFDKVSDRFKSVNIYSYNDDINNGNLSKLYIDTNYYNYENEIKKFINTHIGSNKYHHNDLDKFISNYEKQHKIKFNNEQKIAIQSSMNNNLSIITGGPGTGKSSLIHIIYNYFKQKNTKCIVLTPTGTSSSVIRDKLFAVNNHKITDEQNNKDQDDVMTIDKFILKCKRLDSQPSIIILDEMSMIGIKKFYKLINILNKHDYITKIIMLGDPNQLPSIDIGNIFANLLNFGVYNTTDIKTHNIKIKDRLIKNNIPISYLKKNMRSSSLTLNKVFDGIINEKIDLILENNNNEFIYEQELLCIYKYIQKYKNDIKNTIVLTLTKKNSYGKNDLDNEIHNIILGKNIPMFSIGDRIMCNKNKEYGTTKKYNINNGDIFYIKYKTSTEYTIENENATEFILSNDEITNFFEIAWCITVHKAQGKEFKRVIIVIPKKTYNMLNKNLLFTAITRTKNECILLCSMYQLKKGISVNYPIKRTLLEHTKYHNVKNDNYISKDNRMNNPNDKYTGNEDLDIQIDSESDDFNLNFDINNEMDDNKYRKFEINNKHDNISPLDFGIYTFLDNNNN